MGMALTQSPAGQQGAALLVMLTILVLGSAALLVSALDKGTFALAAVKQDAKALAEARDALIGYSLLAAPRPGELPCPDVTDSGVAPPACNTAASRIGRLPWRTLGIGDLRDSSGARLWYALAASHRPGAGGRLNSSTPGSLEVDGNGDVVAVLLAPGAPLSGQNRANRLSPTAFLEADNADGDSRFVTVQPPPAAGDPPDFNDRVLAIARAELMRPVERHVATVARDALRGYFGANGFYPWAARLGDTGYNCAQNNHRGHLPLASGAPPAPGVACPAGVPALGGLPAWFAANDWNQSLFYVLADACAPGTTGCSGAGGWLQVQPDPAFDKGALLIAAGPALAGQTRPAVSEADLMDSPENSDGDNVFERPIPLPDDNDQVVIP